MEELQGIYYRVHRLSGLSSRSAFKYAPMFYLETAHHHEVRRPWKIEFGCTVVFNQIHRLSCLLSFSFFFSFSLDHAHARSRARFLSFFLFFFSSRFFFSLILLRRASLSHSLNVSHSLLLPLSLFFSLTFSRVLSLSLTLSLSRALSNFSFFCFSFFFFLFVCLNRLSTLISHKYHSRALSSLILRYIFLSICFKVYITKEYYLSFARGSLSLSLSLANLSRFSLVRLSFLFSFSFSVPSKRRISPFA